MSTVPRKLAYLITFLGLLGGAAEGVARLTTTTDDVVFAPQNRIYEDHPTLLWRLRPGAHLDDGTVSYDTNAFGMRSPEVEIPKPDGRWRVLLLGESSTMGAGVVQDRTYASQLQGLLDGQGRGRSDVVNAGTGAWTVWQSSVLLDEYGEKLDPDVVVAYHQFNDVLPSGVIDAHNYLYAVSGTDRQLIEKRRPFRALLGVLLRSRAYLLLRKAVLEGSARLPQAGPGGGGFSPRVPEADRQEAWTRILAWCEAHGARLVVVFPQYGQDFSGDPVLPAFVRSHNLPYLYVPDLVSARGLSLSQFLQNDGVHPTELGHRVIAEGLFPLVQP